MIVFPQFYEGGSLTDQSAIKIHLNSLFLVASRKKGNPTGKSISIENIFVFWIKKMAKLLPKSMLGHVNYPSLALHDR